MSIHDIVAKINRDAREVAFCRLRSRIFVMAVVLVLAVQGFLGWLLWHGRV